MPYLKMINGHSKSVRGAYRYLEGRDGERVVDFDGVNITRESLFDSSLKWYQMMDETREAQGNNKDQKGKRSRTYMHFIISLDPRDDISVDRFRYLVMDWAERFFNSDYMGRYQAAVVFHNDNAERLSKGKQGILHAHVIVNNTCLDDGKRIAPKLTRKVINDMYYDINSRALAEGLHGFATDGHSYTQAEMARYGLNPSRNRNDAIAHDTEIDSHHIPEEETVLDDAKGASDMYEDKSKKPKFRMQFSNGMTFDVYSRSPRSHETMGERKVHEREGHSWKGDIRGRVDVALRLAGSLAEFNQILDLLDIDVTFNSKGEIKYCMRGEENRAKQVLGRTLGARYTLERVNRSVGKNYIERVQRAQQTADSRRQIAVPERDAIIETAREAAPGTREGSVHIARLKAFIKYNDAHRITSYGDYPDTSEGRAVRAWAEEHHAFDIAPFVPITAEEYSSMSQKDRIEYRHLLSEMLGHGGSAYGIDDPSTTPTHRQQSSGTLDSGVQERDRDAR